MKQEYISDALNMLPEDMIEETNELRENPKKPKHNTWKWIAAAACLAFAVYAGIRFLPKWLPAGGGESNPNGSGGELPLLTIAEDTTTMGFEGYLAYDISELVNGNPWEETMELTTLPVYQNRLTYDEYYRASGGDFEAMEAFLLDIALRLGMDTDKLEIRDDTPDEEEQAAIIEKLEMAGGDVPEGYFDPTRLIAESNGIRIEVDTAMTAVIEFEPALTLPGEYNFTYESTYEELETVAEYLKEEYRALIGMEEPVLDIHGGDYNIYNQQGYDIAFYDGKGDRVNRIVNYNFNQAAFYCGDDGKLFLARIFHPDLSVKTGDYPVISPEDAKALLLNGNYITTVPTELPGQDYIAGVELVYRTGQREEYYMPYYRFYVELPDMERDNGLKTYGAYYVPAVDGAYIANMPLWDGSFN